MKNLFPLLILIGLFANAQSPYNTLDTNAISVRINADGINFWDGVGSSNVYIPKSEETSTLFTQNIWVGGYDSEDQLYFVGDKFGNNDIFSSGPICNSTNAAIYDTVWKVNKSTIDYHIANYETAGYEIPYEIESWPANGNINNGEAEYLAPYIDINTNGIYDPENGDYPCIKGDQALYIIYNDSMANSGSYAPMGLEFHAMVYSFANTNNALDSTFFMSYRIFNRSDRNYSNLKLGNFVDFDLGYSFDDFVGCDTTRNMFYVYNGLESDGTGNGIEYGENPPSEGCVLLNKSLSNFMYISNDNSNMGDPENVNDYWDYMNSIWKDNRHLSYGGDGYQPSGGTPVNFAFPGDINNSSEWSQLSEGLDPNDQRGLGCFSIEQLNTGESITLDLAFVYARSNSYINSVNLLKQNVDFVQNFYNTYDWGCDWDLFGSVFANSSAFSEGEIALYSENDSIHSIKTIDLEYDGSYIFEELPMGHYKVKAIPKPPYNLNYQPTFFGNELFFDEAYSINFIGDTYSVDVYLENTTNIGEINQKAYKVYPNPSSNYIYIESKTKTEAYKNIKIINATGSIVLEKNFNNKEILDISHLPNGFYTIKIDSSSYKLIKQ